MLSSHLLDTKDRLVKIAPNPFAKGGARLAYYGMDVTPYPAMGPTGAGNTEAFLLKAIPCRMQEIFVRPYVCLYPHQTLWPRPGLGLLVQAP